MSGQDQNAGGRDWAALAKCWREDAGFRDRLAADPAAALAETGLRLPTGISEVRVAEDTADTFHVVIPPGPNARLSDDALAAVAGGSGRGDAVVNEFSRYGDDTGLSPGKTPRT